MTWVNEALRVFDYLGRPADYRDIFVRTHMSENEAQRCICRLLKAGCIRFVGGSARTGRRYERVPGVPLPADRRGSAEESKKALERARLRRMASRPISGHTDRATRPG